MATHSPRSPNTKAITIDVPPSQVWRMLTKPEMIAGWMSDEELTVISEWRAGSQILFRGKLHGLTFGNRGTIQRFEPETILQYDYWSTLSAARLPEAPENYSMVRFDLTPLGDRTLLTLTLSDFADASVFQHANFYWNGALPLLKALSERTALTRHGVTAGVAGA